MRELFEIQTPLNLQTCAALTAGDSVLLSGLVYTARDAAHRRLFEAIGRGESLPINLRDEVVFYAAPTPARPGQIIGSIGPTTSGRMDIFTPRLIEAGLRGMIGKGSRSPEVIDAIIRHQAVYFGAIGGVAALTARCIKRAAVAAYDDLGPEAILRLEVVDLPLVVINDTRGGDLYRDVLQNA
ncbi:MAG: fumarate hydratase [Syntrophus sp. (in: bacteria)]|nr:fumarate hydratase [Syntrophus sp. (in: bacteria)]